MNRKKQENQKITALYCRISLDDGGDNESMSISNQKIMLRDFAEKNGMFQHEYYVDSCSLAAFASIHCRKAAILLKLVKLDVLSQKTYPDWGEITLKPAAILKSSSQGTMFGISPLQMEWTV